MGDGLQQSDGVAVDFGGTKIAAARVKDGAVVEHVQTKTDGAADIARQIAAISRLLEQLDLAEDDRLGVAVTGRVSRDGIWYALNTNTLAQIDAVPLKRLLSQRFDREVVLMNDAIAAVVGEHVAGAGRGHANLGYLTVSTGVGGGFIIGGKPLQSTTGLSGHAGFTTSRIASSLCGCGRDKTIESVAGGKAIARQSVEAGYAAFDAKAVFAAHIAGQAWASAIIHRSANAIAELCANLKSLLDPDLILLGGSIGLAEGYLELVRGFLHEEPLVFQPEILPSKLGAHAALIGVLATEASRA